MKMIKIWRTRAE